jgi:hypothetical protein
MTKPTSRAKPHIRCGCPDCDWGVPFCGFSEDQLDRYRAEFRGHCIKRHGLSPNDTERICWFNLEGLTLTLLLDE